jgi:hypothetical protein
MKIIIKHEGKKDLINSAYEILVEKIIFGAGQRRGFDKKKGSFRDLQRGVLGYDEYRIEVPNKGVIIYQNWITNLPYLGVVKFEGFDERNEIFLGLKNKLEKIAETEHPVLLHAEFFPKDFDGKDPHKVEESLRNI